MSIALSLPQDQQTVPELSLQAPPQDAARNSPHDGLVPARVGGPVVARLGLVHAVAQAQANVRVHPGQTVVLGQFSLQRSQWASLSGDSTR